MGKKLRHINYFDNESILEIEKEIEKFKLGKEIYEIGELI
jgi:hypothetical protein